MLVFHNFHHYVKRGKKRTVIFQNFGKILKSEKAHILGVQMFIYAHETQMPLQNMELAF